MHNIFPTAELHVNRRYGILQPTPSYTHARARTDTRPHARTHTLTQTCTHTHAHTHACTHMHTLTHTHTHAHTHSHTRTHTRMTHARIQQNRVKLVDISEIEIDDDLDISVKKYCFKMTGMFLCSSTKINPGKMLILCFKENV